MSFHLRKECIECSLSCAEEMCLSNVLNFFTELASLIMGSKYWRLPDLESVHFKK